MGSQESPQSPKKQVHFAAFHTVVGHVCHRKDLTKLEKHKLWFAPSEFQAIMDEALENAFETRKHRQILCDGLDQALQRARRMAHIVQDDDDDDYCKDGDDDNNKEAVNTGSSQQFNLHTYLAEVLEADLGLRVWSEYGPTRRGLERVGASSQEHQHARDRLVRKGIAKVVAVSKKLCDMKSEKACINGKIVVSDESQDSDLIRRVAEHTSRSSVIFARMMGLADAHASGNRPRTSPSSIPEPTCTTKKIRKLPSRESLLQSSLYRARRRGSATSSTETTTMMTTRV